jgi:MipA family protein
MKLANFSHGLPATLLVLSGMCAPSVQAQMGTSDTEPLKLELALGASRGTQSFFKGVLLQSRTDPLIGLNAAKGRWFASVQNGLGYLLTDSPVLSAGVSANYMLGRKESYEARYRGLGNVAGAVGAYGFVEWRPVKDAVTVYANVVSTVGALGAANGSLATAGVTLGLPVTSQLSAFADVYANWANTNYAQTYYGVNATQSVASGYAVYRPQGGLLSSTPSLGLEYAWDTHWRTTGFMGTTRLASLAANSPVVGQRRQPVAALLTTYRF